MVDQQINEVIKALAYGETPEQAAAKSLKTIDPVPEALTTQAEELLKT